MLPSVALGASLSAFHQAVLRTAQVTALLWTRPGAAMTAARAVVVRATGHARKTLLRSDEAELVVEGLVEDIGCGYHSLSLRYRADDADTGGSVHGLPRCSEP
jgi:hypothetical protein